MEKSQQLLTMNNQYYAQLDEQFKERVYNILFDDPSNHDDNEAVEIADAHYELTGEIVAVEETTNPSNSL